MNNLTLDEIAQLIGYKELELASTRKTLIETRRVLEEVTAGVLHARPEEAATPAPEGGTD